MKDRDWELLQDLFARFEATPAAERAEALRFACPDAPMRERVLELLTAADALTAAPPPDSLTGTSLGPYRLVRRIGAGGIGVVYLAERVLDGVSLRSAVKVLAPHAVDSAFVERFHREQQNLAALDHPNITRLLDAGCGANGQPYLVMEYVEGTQLDEYCDGRADGIEARLRLFLQICAAVSNAHRKLIVHLDLKPANVLVTPAGTVKLLDFGTSKLIHLDGDSTSTLMITPAYSSPEQLLNEPVSTASDVFGLGALLFVLLVGRPPFGHASAAVRIEGAVREVEPEALTKAVSDGAAARRGMTAVRLRQALHGDLTAIVAACLRSQPGARYESVEALGEEIKRHLACQPVLARRQTVTYRLGKFIRRHRTAVGAACVAVLTLGLSAAYAWTQQEHALREAERAVRMQTLMFSLFKMANPNYTGKPVATVPEFLRAGIARLPDYIHDPSDLREARLGLAESMFDSGDFAAARTAFSQIISTTGRDDAISDRAEAEVFAGSIEFQEGDISAGRALEADALALSRGPGVRPRVKALADIYFAFNEENNGFKTDENLRLLHAGIEEARARHLPRETTFGMSSLAGVLSMRGRTVEARAIYEELLPLYEADPAALCERSDVYGWLAWIDNTTGDIAASLPLFRKAYEGFTDCAGPGSRMALDVLPYWADALTRLQRAPEAVTLLEDALPVWRAAKVDNADQADLLYFLARAYVKTGRFADAEHMAQEYILKVSGELAPTHRMIGLAHLVLGQALAGQRRYQEASPHARIAVDLLVKSAVSAYGRQLGAEATELVRQVGDSLAAR